MDEKLETFDVIAYFEDRNIVFYEDGKNVTQGWVNIQCPLGNCSDPSNHCGVNLESKFFSCWQCGEKGPATKLITHLENCSYDRAQRIINEFQNIYQNYQIEETTSAESVNLPSGISEKPRKNQIEYLENRNFDTDYLIKKYDIMFGGLVGEYRHRIIIPFYEKKELITFTSRAISDKAELKYKHCPIKDSIIDVKRTFYNINSITDTVVIVEGVTDVWRFGDGSVAVMGTVLTAEQLVLIKNVKRVFILLDSGESHKAKKLASQLIMIPHIEIIELDSGDPADLLDSDIKHMRKLFLLT